MGKNKNRVITFLLAILLLVTALPLQVLAAPKTVTVKFTDGAKEVQITHPVESPLEIPNTFKPPEGMMITSVVDENGQNRNPSNPLNKDEVLKISYGKEITTTFSIVGNKKWNGDKGWQDQIIEPQKITLTIDEINEQNQKYNLPKHSYASLTNVFIKAMEEKGYMNDQVKQQLNYISNLFDLKTGSAPGGKDGWMNYVNHSYADRGMPGQHALNNDYIRIFFVDDYTENSYTWFDNSERDITLNEPFEVSLNYSKYSSDNNETIIGKYEGATILIDGEPYLKDGQVVKTDQNGNATISISNPNSQYISATVENEKGLKIITMPYMTLSINKKDDTADDYVPKDWINETAQKISEKYDGVAKERVYEKVVLNAKYKQLKGTFNVNQPTNQETIDILFDNAVGKDRNAVAGDRVQLSEYVLALRALGYNPENFFGFNLIEELASKQFSRTAYPKSLAPTLIALNSDDYNASKGVEEAKKQYIDAIIDQQKAGNWIIDEQTGLALYALAPFYNNPNYPGVKDAIDKGLEFISKKVKDDGDATDEFGMNQALLSGVVATINPSLLTDPKFMPKDKTLYDGLKKYQIEEGFKRKVKDTKEYPLATQYALRSFISYIASQDGGYVFDFRNAPKRDYPESKKIDDWVIDKTAKIANQYKSKGKLDSLYDITALAKYEWLQGNYDENTINAETREYIKSQLIDEKSGDLKKNYVNLAQGILAVRAAGMDPEDYYGFNLVQSLIQFPNKPSGAFALGQALSALASDKYTTQGVDEEISNLIQSILSKQNEDGIWSPKVGSSTAMTMYGLAPFYNDPSHPEVKTALDKATAYTWQNLGDNGDFAADPGNSLNLSHMMGALASIDPTFLEKNIRETDLTLIQSLKSYDFERGLKLNKTALTENTGSTSYGFRALTSYLSMKDEKGYVFDLSQIPKIEEKSPTIPEQWIQEKAAGIAKFYGEQEALEDWWKIIELAKYNQIQETFTENTINQKSLDYLKSVTLDQDTNKAKEDFIILSKSVLALRSAGIDPEDYYGNNLVELLAKSEVTRPNPFEYARGLSALNSDNYQKSPSIEAAKSQYIQKLLDSQEENGLWLSSLGVDNTGFALYGLAPYYNDPKYPEITKSIDKALDAIAKVQLENGDFKEGIDGNTNSISKVIGGIASVNPELLADKKFSPKNNTMFHALKDYEHDYGFKRRKFDEEVNDLSTEQGFRALVAYLSMKEKQQNIFDFKDVSKRVLKEELPEVNKSDLQQAITTAETKAQNVVVSTDGKDVDKDKTWVTEDAQKALDEALAAAKAVVANGNATQEEVENALSALNTAITNYTPQAGTKDDTVTPPVVNKSDLQQAITIAENKAQDVAVSTDGTDVDKDKTWVTSEAQKALAEALAAAREILAKEDATEQHVTEATNALQAAIASYTPQAGTKADAVTPPAVNKAELAETINVAKAHIVASSINGRDIDPSKTWTSPEDLKLFLTAITKAETVFRDPAAHQAQIDQAIKDLAVAIQNYDAMKRIGSKESPRWNDGYVPAFRPTITRSNPVKPETKSEVKPDVQPQPIPHFIDTPGHWAEDVINYVVEKGYFKGTGPDTFSPNRTSTRAELITVLGRIAGINPNDYKTSALPDIQSGTFYDGYANWAVSVGIIKGNERGEFEPNREITREEVAAILARYFAYIGKNQPASGKHTYQDQNDISPWARDAVNQLTEAGILKGQGENTFAPQKDITRAEIAQLIYNMDQKTMLK